MRYYTAMKVKCGRVITRDGKKFMCGQEAVFDNPDGDAPYLLDRKAVAAGWYLALGMSGADLCPGHHREEAAKWKVASLYEDLPIRGFPLEGKGTKGTVKQNE